MRCHFRSLGEMRTCFLILLSLVTPTAAFPPVSEQKALSEWSMKWD
jgi:hypothetical protein